MKQIKVGLIGLGRVAQGYRDTPTHFSVLKKDKRFALVAGADPKKSAREVFWKKSKLKVYADYGKMLQELKPELVVVASPTETHYQICKDLMQKGSRAILCEKPLAYSSAQAREILALAKRKRVKIAVNYQRAFDKGYNRLRETVKKKKWGDFLAAEVVYSKGIFNTATHALNLLERMVGPAKRVQSLEKTVIRQQDPTISFLVEFGKGFAVFWADKKTKASKFKLKLYFTKAVIEVIDDARRSMEDVYENLYGHIAKGKKPLSSPEEAFHALRVAEAGVRSVKLNQAITLSK